MAHDLNGLIFSFAAYLLGSIPFGLVASQICGTQDPRKAGSGNIGSTNVLRLSGKKVGALTLLGDLGKGWVIGWVALNFFSQNLWGLIGVLAVVTGHIFPVFLKFQGGKGVATGLGGILGFHFEIGIFLLSLWLLTVLILKYSSVGALVSFGAFPILSWIYEESFEFIFFSLLLSGIIFITHKGNIGRLLNGTESRVGS